MPHPVFYSGNSSPNYSTNQNQKVNIGTIHRLYSGFASITHVCVCVCVFNSVQFYHMCELVPSPQTGYRTVPLPGQILVPLLYRCSVPHLLLPHLSTLAALTCFPCLSSLSSWNPTRYSLLRLACFTQHNALESHPSQWVSGDHSFLLLSSIPPYGYIADCLTIHPWKDLRLFPVCGCYT